MKPILYRPPPKWQFWAYLGGALLLHAIAVVAAMKHEPPPMDLASIPDAVVIGLEQAPQEPEPTPPPEEPEAPPPPPPPTSEPEFKEEAPTPPPKPKQQVKIQPLAKPTQVGATVTAAGAKANAVYAPKPPYPYEARAKHLTGSGVCVVDVDSSGNVTNATMAQSIGAPMLDNSATSTFRQWKFKPGSVSRAKIPITFTMTGASY